MLKEQSGLLVLGRPTEDGWSSKQGCVKGAVSRGLRTIRPSPCCHASPKIQTFGIHTKLQARTRLLIRTGHDHLIFSASVAMLPSHPAWDTPSLSTSCCGTACRCLTSSRVKADAPSIVWGCRC